MVLPWAVLGPAVTNITNLVGFCDHLLFKNFSKHFFILDTLMTLLPFSVMKRNATSFFKNSIFYTHLWFLLTRKKLSINCYFLMFWSKNLTKFYLLQLRKPTFTGQYRHWDQRRERLILLALAFTEFLTYALVKISQVESTKSKISCDRMVIQKK